jgi:lipooligosaccharide transport system permease protein
MAAVAAPVPAGDAAPSGELRPLAAPARPWRGVFGYYLVAYKRTWRASLFSSFGNPILYLLALGYGLGDLVDKGHATGASASLPHGVGYLAYLAPGLLAATMMQTAANECTYPVFAAIKWLHIYDGMLASPIGVRAVVTGEQLWVAARLTMNSAVFVAVMAAFGAAHSPWLLAALPASVLTGLAFTSPIAAFSAAQENDSNFSALFRFGVMPMFLFSGTFFPVDQLPAALRPLAWITPLWHGVDLCRTLALGTAHLGMTALHVAYLLAWFAAGFAMALRTWLAE